MAKATCSVEGCDDLAKVHGDCRKHYKAKWYRENRQPPKIAGRVVPGQAMPNNAIARSKAGRQAFSDEEARLLKTYYESHLSIKQSDMGSWYGVSTVGMGRTLLRVGTRMREQVRFQEAELHPGWRGGRTLHVASGYVVVKLARDSPYAAMRDAAGGTKEHRLVMAEHLGRPLLRSESVHHINGKRADNRIENLQLRIGAHGPGSAYQCSECGSRKLEPVEITKESNLG